MPSIGTESDRFVLTFDGACLPNPNGYITIAYTLSHNDKQVLQTAAILGRGIDNDSETAEYHALIEGLNTFCRSWVIPGSSLEIRGDYAALIKRLNGEWLVKRNRVLHHNADRLIRLLRRNDVSVALRWISREQNAQCDALAKKFREEKFLHGEQLSRVTIRDIAKSIDHESFSGETK